jgi:hypothetical protein
MGDGSGFGGSLAVREREGIPSQIFDLSPEAQLGAASFLLLDVLTENYGSIPGNERKQKLKQAEVLYRHAKSQMQQQAQQP